jgi:spore coat polysaccharide biosynthesis protein SpsF
VKVLIGIQARSGSTRLPRKAWEPILGRMMLDRVIDACRTAIGHIKRKHGCDAKVVVLTPEGDPIVGEFGPRCEVIEGPEQDVLSRYKIAMDREQPDYLVRITGDCPLIPYQLIAGIVNLGLTHEYDYISNVDERFRTMLDGVDVEVISHRLFLYAAGTAKERADREHVTTFIRRNPPEWAKTAMVVTHFDHSDIKLSVDTPEDLARVRKSYEQAFSKFQSAIAHYGNGRVHRI